MKYQIRKLEFHSACHGSEVVNLDPEDFRELEGLPYTGSTEKEFLSYVEELVQNLAYDDQVPTNLPEALRDTLMALLDTSTYTQIWDSREKGEESYLESGEVDPKCRSTGGFKVSCETKPKEKDDW